MENFKLMMMLNEKWGDHQQDDKNQEDEWLHHI